VPPHTEAVPLTFDDVPFRVENFTDPATGTRHACARCGATDSFLDEFMDEAGGRVHQCSDADHCRQRLDAGTRIKDAA
jgi:alpha-D-ribose 1-methylphosphonate 5-phosphate C-P lyase